VAQPAQFLRRAARATPEGPFSRWLHKLFSQPILSWSDVRHFKICSQQWEATKSAVVSQSILGHLTVSSRQGSHKELASCRVEAGEASGQTRAMRDRPIALGVGFSPSVPAQAQLHGAKPWRKWERSVVYRSLSPLVLSVSLACKHVDAGCLCLVSCRSLACHLLASRSLCKLNSSFVHRRASHSF
jgi:hypothetical protein